TYSVVDTVSGQSDIGTVTITVDPVNDAPVALPDQYTVVEDSVIIVGESGGLLFNDYDVDEDTLTVMLIGYVSHGELLVNSDGSFQYTPDPGFSETDQFYYQAFDGQEYSSLTEVIINVTPVNDPPVAEDISVTLLEDGSASITLVGTDEDTHDPDLIIDIVDSTSYGSLELQGRLYATYVYTPAQDYFGADTFTYRVFDTVSLQADTGTVAITVEAVNDAPVAGNDEYETQEDDSLVVNAPGILDNDEDVDDITLTIMLESDVDNGDLDLHEDGSFVYIPDP
ncbi:uncharacterized protein METZ01_LOCUS403143, partial [marine metagenome]